MTPETCPNCGADVPPDAKACPECGSCEATGWSEEALTDSLGLPDESFNYDEFVQREFGGKKREVKPRGVPWFWWAIAIVVVLAMLALVLG